MEPLYAGMTIQNVINRFSDTLIRIAFQNTKVLSDAEDIVQEVYIKLLNNKGDFNSDEHLKAWLIKVTCNKCKDFFKSAWFKRVVPLNDNMDFLAPDEQEVMEEIFQLKRSDRNIIFLYYYEGYNISEIASILGKKQNTISSQLQRARKKLRHILEEGS